MTPVLGVRSFTCPHCGIFAQQQWSFSLINEMPVRPEAWFDDVRNNAAAKRQMSERERGSMKVSMGLPSNKQVEGLHLGHCSACDCRTIWHWGTMIFPSPTNAPKAGADLPEIARGDYEEAARVLQTSPRAAAALLRLSLEKLLGHLLGRQQKIDTMIADFVAKGVAPQIQQAMDILRVTGNEAVHPGTMTQVDDVETALGLFGLINLIVEVMITQPRHVQQMFDALPEAKRQGIEVRNAKALQPTKDQE